MKCGDYRPKVKSAFADTQFMNHEDAHSTQWALLGTGLFAGAWTGGGGASCGNALESGAGNVDFSGYAGCDW